MDLSTVGEVDLWIAEAAGDGTPDRLRGRLNLDFGGGGVIFGEPRAAKRETDRLYAEMSDLAQDCYWGHPQRDLSIHPQPVDNSPFIHTPPGLGKTHSSG